MTDVRTGELVLAAAMECGALQTAILLHEVARVAGVREFTGAELCEWAEEPGNTELKAAIVTACGRVSSRVLGKHLAAIRGHWIGFHSVKSIGKEERRLIWRVVSRAKLSDPSDASSGLLSTASRNPTTSMEQDDE